MITVFTESKAMTKDKLDVDEMNRQAVKDDWHHRLTGWMPNPLYRTYKLLLALIAAVVLVWVIAD